jgi:predicted transposase/invertase (TIGR01784 family)
MEKASIEDKLSILDVRATLADGTSICIEMHLYDVIDLKFKTLRSLARVYSEELEPGQKYRDRNNVICISFADGYLRDDSDIPIRKIHSLFYMIERDSHEVLTTDMEMHHINMNKFITQFEKPMDEMEEICESLKKWLVFITQKEIDDKDTVRRICTGKEMEDAMEALTKLSESKIERQRYQRRLDELYSYNELNRRLAEQNKAIADKDAVLAEQSVALADRDAALAEQSAALADKDAALAEQSAALADRDAALADKDAALADKDAQISKLLTQLEAR